MRLFVLFGFYKLFIISVTNINNIMMKTMDFKIVKNKNGYFNLSMDRSPSITMVDLDKEDVINLRDVLNEMLKNEEEIGTNKGYAYGYNPKTKRLERI